MIILNMFFFRFWWYIQINYTSYDIQGITKVKTLLHRLAETTPVNLCNSDMEILAIS